MSARAVRAVAGLMLGALAAAALMTGCSSSPEDYDRPASPPLVQPLMLNPEEDARIYQFKVMLYGVENTCVAFDGGYNGGLHCQPEPGAPR